MKAPVSWDITEEELPHYLAKRHGVTELAYLEVDLRALERNGTNLPGMRLGSLTQDNQAGPDKSTLSIDELYEQYTRAIYTLNKEVQGVPAGTRCRVWNSRAGRCNPESKALHVRTFDMKDLYHIPLKRLDLIQE